MGIRNSIIRSIVGRVSIAIKGGGHLGGCRKISSNGGHVLYSFLLISVLPFFRHSDPFCCPGTCER